MNLTRKPQICGKRSVPSKQPSGRHPKPQVGSTGTPRDGSHPSLSFQLPFPAATPCRSRNCSVDVQTRGAGPTCQREIPPNACFVELVEGVVGNCTVPALLHICGCLCVCASLCQDVVSQTLVLRAKVILRNAKAYFGFRSLYICHNSVMPQLCTFLKNFL